MSDKKKRAQYARDPICMQLLALELFLLLTEVEFL